ncbi:MAG: hypothetical protein KAH31_02255 [Candidatus Sabulitectum sp.]|nr:hypothetical protein [Candidatus Sabulitectum sp.]
MGSGKSILPLTVLPGREITDDTLFLAELAGSVPCSVCFDLGTGTGAVLKNASLEDAFRIGIDLSFQALRLFDRAAGQPVQCCVGMVSSVFLKGCADLVLANPPYNTLTDCRHSPDPLRREARQGDSLLLYRFIFAGAHLLRSGGCMIITGREEKIPGMKCGLRAAGFSRIEEFRRGRVIAIKAILTR